MRKIVCLADVVELGCSEQLTVLCDVRAEVISPWSSEKCRPTLVLLSLSLSTKTSVILCLCVLEGWSCLERIELCNVSHWDLLYSRLYSPLFPLNPVLLTEDGKCFQFIQVLASIKSNLGFSISIRSLSLDRSFSFPGTLLSISLIFPFFNLISQNGWKIFILNFLFLQISVEIEWNFIFR